MAGILETIFKLLGLAKAEYDNYQKTEKSNYTTTPSAPEPKKREVKELVQKVVDSEYIRDLRLGRSWVLPKMIEMCFDRKGNFSEARYYQSISKLDHSKCWDFLVRNYHVMSLIADKDKKGYEARAKWWSKDVAVAIAQRDLDLLKSQIARGMYVSKGCRGGDYVSLPTLRGRFNKYDKMFFLKAPSADFVNKYKEENETIADLYDDYESNIQLIKFAATPKDLATAVRDYNWGRCLQPGESMPEEFINAYAGDGAYSAMMTMVKYLGLTFDGLDRDACIAAIESKAKEVGNDGRQLFSYCAAKFFESGVFDYKAYKSRR